MKTLISNLKWEINFAVDVWRDNWQDILIVTSVVGLPLSIIAYLLLVTEVCQ